MDKLVLTVQDVSCVGQCSLTVALPVLSAFGVETAVLPTAVLSNHTAFKSWTFEDLTEQIPLISKEWQKQGVYFDAIYTGYLGSKKQIDYIKELVKANGKESCLVVVDPAMADHGKLYAGFDLAFVEEMKSLVAVADIAIPNITEACFLTGIEYREEQTEEYVNSLIDGLISLGAKKVVLTGVSFTPEKLGVAVYDGGLEYRFEDYLDKKYHGTGDIFASAFTGAYLLGWTTADAAQLAAQVVIESIRHTMGDEKHWYGVRFEKALPFIIEKISNK